MGGWAAAAQVAGSIIDSGMGYLWNTKLADQQNALNIQQWERNNAYNTPAAQMQRLKDAGLNPLLIYGGGPGNTAAPSPNMVKPQVDFHAFSQGIDALYKYTQIENAEAQNANIKAQNEVLHKQAEAQGIENWKNDRENRILKQSDKSGFMVSANDPSVIRLGLKALNSSAMMKFRDRAAQNERIYGKDASVWNQLKKVFKGGKK